MLESGDNRREPVSTSGGKEMARGTSREDTLAVFQDERSEVEEVARDKPGGAEKARPGTTNERRPSSFSLKNLTLFQ
jgi:hypothetical protein